MAKAKRATPHSPPAGRKDDGTQIKRLRRLCLSIPGTTEKLSQGEPTFFTPKRVFAMFANNHHDDGHIAVWLPMGPGVQEALIVETPEIYFRPPSVGPSGWIGVEMARVDGASQRFIDGEWVDAPCGRSLLACWWGRSCRAPRASRSASLLRAQRHCCGRLPQSWGWSD